MAKLKHTTLVARVRDGDEALLLQPLLGVTWLERQLRALSASFDDIVVLLPLAADALRRQIRELAVRLPVRIATYNLDPKFYFWLQLRGLASHLEERVLVGDLLDPALAFQAATLADGQGELCLAVQKEKPPGVVMCAKTDGRFVTGVTARAGVGTRFLTGTMRWTRDVLTNLPLSVSSDSTWRDFLAQLARDEAVHVCEFEPDEGWPRLISSEKEPVIREKWQIWAQTLLEREPPVSSAWVQVAPTARLHGQVILGENVKIGEYCVLEGPLYLGAGTRVAPFCCLRGVITEEKCTFLPYSHLEGEYLPPRSQTRVSVKTEITRHK